MFMTRDYLNDVKIKIQKQFTGSGHDIPFDIKHPVFTCESKSSIMKNLQLVMIAVVVLLSSCITKPGNENQQGQVDTENEYVDLGLSVRWATCNLGASSPEKYGSFYQWAGTKDVKALTNYLFFNTCPYHNALTLEFPGWTKYNTKSSYGTVDNKTVLEAADDVAHVTLGGQWRIPTEAEWRELIESCTWVWTNLKGTNGYMGTSKVVGYTDKTIFLPAAGYREDVHLDYTGVMGSYWSSSLNPDRPSCAYTNTFNSSLSSLNKTDGGGVFRYFGQSIRPVM